MTWVLTARDWFMGRNLRERWLLALMAAIAVPLLVILLIYQPLMQRLEEAKVRHVAAVQRHGAVLVQLDQLDAAPGNPAAATGGPPLSIRITDAAARAGVRLTANEPRGPGIAAITIAPAPPTATLRWLRELEANGISIRELAISPQGGGGAAVTATLAVGGAS